MSYIKLLCSTIQSEWCRLLSATDEHRLGLLSPVPHLQTCNDPPSHSEEQLVHQALENAENLRQRIRDALEHGTINNKTRYQPQDLTIIDDFCLSLRSVLSPIRKVPFELLQTIFMLAFKGQGRYGWNHCPSALSGVCRRWRQICLATPTLWTHFPQLNMYASISDIRIQKAQKIFTLLMERSGRAPLHVHIVGSISSGALHPLFKALMDEFDRWETAVLSMYWSTFQEHFGPLQGRLKLLRRLRLNLHKNNDSERTPPVLWDIFSDTPSAPQSSTQQMVPSAPRAIHTFIPPSNIQSLSLGLRLDAEIPSRIVLPHLKRFKLSLQERYRPIALNALVLPALEDLTLNLGDAYLYPFVLNLVERSSSESTGVFPANGLHIESHSTPEFVISMIKLLPALKHLQIWLTGNCYQVVKRLACADDLLAPQLEVCTFWRNDLDRLSLVKPQLVNLCRMRCYRSPFASNPMATKNRESAMRPFSLLKAVVIRSHLGMCTGNPWVPERQPGPVPVQTPTRVPAGFAHKTHPKTSKTDEIWPFPGRFGRFWACFDAHGYGNVNPYPYPTVPIPVTRTGCPNPCTSLFTLPRPKVRSLRASVEDYDERRFALKELSACLYAVVKPSVAYGFMHEVKIVPPDLSSAKNILKVLKECQKKDVDPRYIYIHQLHLQLRALNKWVKKNGESAWSTSSEAPVVFSELREVMKETLDSWRRIVYVYSSQIKWAAITPTYLMYIPDDDPIRSSSEAIKLARGYESYL
ncbi:hypothetical protein CVT24_003656 [Panaeolus cyanescens]|uniref:Uncharacterized protein n=1 Tax=Panaeolus cyanescens TaxID=181874 RepID=A0A409YXH7_9AGAR|nr:hypothetical protein CVT24_003656 [Panaeolus cyanescens]